MCSSLDGSHSRAITSIAAIVAHGTRLAPLRPSAPAERSSAPAPPQRPAQPHVPEAPRRSDGPRSTPHRIASALRRRSRTARSAPRRPVIRRASASRPARPSPSSSPSCATVSCTTLRRRAHRPHQTPIRVRLSVLAYRRVAQNTRDVDRTPAAPNTRGWLALHALPQTPALSARHLRRSTTRKRPKIVANCGTQASPCRATRNPQSWRIPRDPAHRRPSG